MGTDLTAVDFILGSKRKEDPGFEAFAAENRNRHTITPNVLGCAWTEIEYIQDNKLFSNQILFDYGSLSMYNSFVLSVCVFSINKYRRAS